MNTHFDAIVLGMGPGGEVAASRLLDAGLDVAVVERELIGGECGYWACIPSKTVLRPVEVADDVAGTAGVGGASLSWSAARDYRDVMVRHLDDRRQVEEYETRGAAVFKGAGRLTGPGRVRVGDLDLTAEHVIVAAGTVANVPDIPGLDTADVWTNREAYTADALPRRAAIIGGSAVGIETATFLAGFGVETTLVHRGARLLEREEAHLGELAQQQLERLGVQILLDASPAAVHPTDDGASRLVLEARQGSAPVGTEVTVDVVVLATGRHPRTDGLGVEAAGGRLGGRGEILVDGRCRAADGLWAVGDVTGLMPFTHVAKYQGRLAADAILEKASPEAHYDGVPRVVFGVPELAAVGLTSARAEERGLTVQSVELDLTAALARPWTYGTDPQGWLGLLADPARGVLVGAWAVGPQAGEWIHYAALAVRAEIPVDVLRDQVAQFPSFHEAYLAALDMFDF